MLTYAILFFLSVIGVHSSPSPKAEGDPDWWKTAVFYQIYPRSFKDSNNDGIGDLQGIISKLDHLKDAGVTAAWLSPIYPSPMVDAGYDISDYRGIHPDFGTMEDFEELLAKAKELGLKIILDFVPNHTSDQHVWFSKSANREPGYEDYYVWLDGQDGNTKPPNNWISNFHGSAWNYSEVRNQWYLHQFAIQQPDLNYRDPRLVQEMKDVLTFWLDKGVAGFRIDTIPNLVEKGDFPDEPRSYDPNALETDFQYLLHPYTSDQPETYDMVYQWRALLDEYTEKNGGDARIIMTESYSEIHKAVLYYGNETHNGAHFTFNFLFITDLNINSTARDIVFTVLKWLTYMPSRFTANWVQGNHDQHRVATRFGLDRADGFNMLAMLLPGVGVTYNGDEIAMEDGYVSWEQTQDPQALGAGEARYLEFSRDPERTPYQWNDTVNAGFNEGHETWLPVSDKYKEVNLAKEIADRESHYHIYQDLLKLRKSRTLQEGDLNIKPLSDTVFALTRELDGSETYVLVVNVDNSYETADLSVFRNLSDVLAVNISSVGSSYSRGTTLAANNIQLAPKEALVLTDTKYTSRV